MQRIAVAVLLLWVAACSRGIDNKDAVRQGVVDHLAAKTNLNVKSMSVEVTSVSFRGDQADATVSFAPKGGSPESGMSMRYTLRKQGNRWVVTGRADSGGAPHGGMTMPGTVSPHTGGAAGAAAPPGTELPPGHPAVGGKDGVSGGKK